LSSASVRAAGASTSCGPNQAIASGVE
jgi:hypothetical protein